MLDYSLSNEKPERLKKNTNPKAEHVKKKKQLLHKIHLGFNDDNTENIVFKIVLFKKNALFFTGNNITS